MKATAPILVALLTLAATFNLFAQDATLESSFNPVNRASGLGFQGPLFDSLPGFSGRILDMIMQEDGKTVVIGNFHSYDGMPTPGIVRLGVNGEKDLTFREGEGFNKTPTVI